MDFFLLVGGFMNEKTVEIEWNGGKVNVIVKGLQFGESNRIQEKYIKFKFVGTQPEITMDAYKMKEETILRGIKDAPFDRTLTNIGQLSVSDAEKLYGAIQEITGLSEEKKTQSEI